MYNTKTVNRCLKNSFNDLLAITYSEEDTCGIAVYSARVMLGIEPFITSLKAMEMYHFDEGEELQEFLLYPNPAEGQITIEFRGESDLDGYSIEFFDMLGKSVKTMKLEENTTILALKDLSQGVYFYSIKDRQTRIQQGKIVKL
jgi:hypothetical protein